MHFREALDNFWNSKYYKSKAKPIFLSLVAVSWHSGMSIACGSLQCTSCKTKSSVHWTNLKSFTISFLWKEEKIRLLIEKKQPTNQTKPTWFWEVSHFTNNINKILALLKASFFALLLQFQFSSASPVFTSQVYFLLVCCPAFNTACMIVKCHFLLPSDMRREDSLLLQEPPSAILAWYDTVHLFHSLILWFFSTFPPPPSASPPGSAIHWSVHMADMWFHCLTSEQAPLQSSHLCCLMS